MKQLKQPSIENIIALKKKYEQRISDLYTQSKQIDIFYSNKNLTRYKVDKEYVTSRMEELRDVVNDLEELLK